MKKSKIIIPALAMLVMSTAATVTGTVAWFSMNKTVTAEGMLVRAQGQGSIVISKYNANADNKGRPQTTTKTTGIDFTHGIEQDGTASNKLFPTTHIKGSDTYGTYAEGLKYVENGNIICYETGMPKNSTSSITWHAVASAQDYFVDCDLFIGGDGQDFDHHDVSVSFGTLANNIANINKAVSIDIYAEEECATTATVDSTHFVGTLNVAGVNAATNNATVLNPNKQTISDVKISKSGSATALAIKLRVYYDGALVDRVGTNPVENYNGFTSYTKITAANAKVSDYANAEYFYNADGDIMLAKAYDANGDLTNGDDIVTNLYVVNTTYSTSTYARSVDYADLANVALNVVFTATAHS